MHRVSDFCMRANVIDVNFMTVTITIRIVNWFSAKDRADDGRERERKKEKSAIMNVHIHCAVVYADETRAIIYFNLFLPYLVSFSYKFAESKSHFNFTECCKRKRIFFSLLFWCTINFDAV